MIVLRRPRRYYLKNTKSKLLDTATQIFAEFGFDSVSTRDLVTMSGVNLCTINYYFGSKQNLYDAVIDSIVENVNTNVMCQIDKFIAENKTSPMKCLLYSMNAFFDYLFSSKVSNYMALIAVREFLIPSGHESRLYKKVIEPVRAKMLTMIMEATGCSKQVAYIYSHSLVSQVTSLKLMQNIERYSNSFFKSAKSQILENCKTLLLKEKERVEKNK